MRGGTGTGGVRAAIAGDRARLTAALVALLCLVQTGLAYIFYFGAMGELPVQEVALLGYLEPVVSVLSFVVLSSEVAEKCAVSSVASATK